MTRKRPTRRAAGVSRRMLMALAVTVGLLLVASWLAISSGTVSGIQFSPDTFEHRSFRYYVVGGIQITTTKTEVCRTDFERYLADKGFLNTEDAFEPRWLLVKGSAPGVRGWHGEAKWLCFALGCFNGESQAWVSWSRDNPEQAAQLWPQVIALAREEEFGEAYELLSDMRATTLDPEKSNATRIKAPGG